jgi:hypothetical protein
MPSRRDIIAETLRAELARRSSADPVGEYDVPWLADAIDAALEREDSNSSGHVQPNEGRRPEELNAENDG